MRALNLINHLVWRHKKRGNLYTVLGTSQNRVFYVGHEDRSYWYRPTEDFLDGRFERVIGVDPLKPDETGFREA